MKVERKLHGSAVMPIAVGIGSGLSVYLLISAVIAIMLSNGVTPERHINLLVNICRFLSVFAAAVMTGLMSIKKKALCSLGASVGVVVIWLTISALYLDGSIVDVPAALISVFLGNLCAILLILTKIRPSTGGYKKKHYR